MVLLAGMGLYLSHTDIVNTIFGVYVNIIEKYLSHIKTSAALQKEEDDGTQLVVFQQSILFKKS